MEEVDIRKIVDINEREIGFEDDKGGNDSIDLTSCANSYRLKRINAEKTKWKCVEFL